MGHEIVRKSNLVRWAGFILQCLIVVVNWNTIRRASKGHESGPISWFWAGIALGILIYLLERAIIWLRIRAAGAGTPKVGVGGKRMEALARFFEPTGASTRVAVRGAKVSLFGRKKDVPQWLTRGYLTPDGENLRLSEVHVKMLIAAVAMLVIYFLTFFVSKNHKPPAPAYIALVLTVLVLLIGALAFFFDAYRIPVLLPLAIWIVVASRNPKADHYFAIVPSSREEMRRTDPGTVLAEAKADGRPIVLVAAAGGGIQAAAWTTQVLAGLESKLDSIEPGIFAKSVRLLSGVSGGSTGIMFYVQSAYPVAEADPATEQNRLNAAVQAAESSSLELVTK